MFDCWRSIKNGSRHSGTAERADGCFPAARPSVQNENANAIGRDARKILSRFAFDFYRTGLVAAAHAELRTLLMAVVVVAML